jgi:hypothetical protein
MAIYTATGPSAAEVQAAMDLATGPGDIVAIPAGVGNWTFQVVWNMPVGGQLIGAGTTIIGGGDETDISDDFISSSPLLVLNLQPSGLARVSGITFRSGSATAEKGNGTIQINGPGLLRVDHCNFEGNGTEATAKIVYFGKGIKGVMDQCTATLHGSNAFYFYNGRSGVGETQGNLEFTLPTAFGSDDFFFLEDNAFSGQAITGGWPSYPGRLADGFIGAKVVVRFNNLHNICAYETHPTGNAGDARGQRAVEVYCNVSTTDWVDVGSYGPNEVLADISNGTGRVWGNDANGVYKGMFSFKVTRDSNATYPQQPTPDGWGYAGTAFNGTGSNWDGGTFTGTDTLYGYPALDQPGRGASPSSDLLVGLFPNKTNSRTGTIEWPNQALEPIYIWANVGANVGGWGKSYYNADIRVQPDRDYYQQASGIQTSPTSPFNGTTGTGWGTLANRPTEPVAPGVGYWAIDEGSWNLSESNARGVNMAGASGRFYVANSEGEWEQEYEPYVYPHPLRSTEPAAPSFLSHPQSVSKTVGQNHTFSVSVLGTPYPTFQWRKGGVNISGATSSSLALTDLQTSDAGSYDCVITNTEGTATSDAAVLSVSSGGGSSGSARRRVVCARRR